MKTLKGPGIFLAQFIADEAPYNNLETISKWASSLGFKGVQIPTNDPNFFDVQKVAESKTYADEIKGKLKEQGVEITELSTHLQGQLVAVHPAYDKLFDGFAPEKYRNNPKARTEWAIDQLKLAAKASANLGLNAHATFSGALLWHMVYPWPQRPAGAVETGFKELAKRWLPILDEFDKNGMDYLSYIDHYHERIKMFHVKDAEFNPTGKQGVYGGYSGWVERAGRFRSLGDGQVDFKGIFSKLAAYDFDGWAVMEWECALKNSVDGATEGAQFIKNNIIKVTDKAFDDFAATGADEKFNKEILGI